MVKIKKQLVSDTPNKFGKNNKREKVAVHETANTAKGANAQVHANLQSNGNSRAANWHWQCDDKHCIQSFDHSFSLYHAGDGSGDGNMNSIGVEICVNSDADQKKAYQNAAELIKKLMKEEGISKDNVKQHNHFSGKDCPHFLRAGKWYNWSDFMKLVDGSRVSKPKKTKTKSKTASKTTGGLKSKVNGLRFYNKPSWKDANMVGSVDKGVGFPTVVKKVKVGSAHQYKVKNSKGSVFYITAAPKYVNVSGSVSKKKSKPASKSGKAGKLKIVGVSNAAIVMDKPNSNNSNNIGTVKKGATLPLNGSVAGGGSGYWEVQYKGKLGYITGKYGKQV